MTVTTSSEHFKKGAHVPPLALAIWPDDATVVVAVARSEGMVTSVWACMEMVDYAEIQHILSLNC